MEEIEITKYDDTSIVVKEPIVNETVRTVEQLKSKIESHTRNRDYEQSEINHYTDLLNNASDLGINID